MSKRGFTLVELLAVIVILAIILAIAIPGISGIINSSTESAFESNAKLLLKAVEYKLLQDETFDVSTVNEANINTLLGVSGSNYQSIKITILNGKPYLALQGQNKWAGLVAYGSNMEMDVSDSVTYQTAVNQLGYNVSEGVNTPVLATGMTPIKWNGTTWLNTTSSDPDWYNYDTTNKTWANAKTADGSMWVWIPRYIYKISTGWHTNTAGTIDVQFSKGIDDNWNNTSIGNIDTGTTSNASNNKWTNHPGFDFGTTKLTGIWVAKFEATASEGVANGYTADDLCPTAGDNVTTKTIKVIPNVASWRCIQIGNAFTVSRNMETNSIYGWGTTGNGIDTHMIKNTEWGATAYLSKSSYGQGTSEIWINPDSNLLTGRAGTGVSAASTATTYAYSDATYGVNAGTTGNAYGVFGMSGGTREFTAAYFNNGHANLTTNGNDLIIANAKYKDVYTVTTDDSTTNYSNAVNSKGDAIYETSSSGVDPSTNSWFGDYSQTPSLTEPFFTFGGRYTATTRAGTFAFDNSTGVPLSYMGFRPVLLIGAGL